MLLTNANEVREFREDIRQQTQITRTAMAERYAVAACYYNGWPYVGRWGNVDRLVDPNDTLKQMNGRIATNRYAMNRIDRYIIKIAAASFLQKLDPQVLTPLRDVNPEIMHQCTVNAALIRHIVQTCGMLEAARLATLRRCLAGQWLIGLSLNAKPRRVEVDGKVKVIEDAVMTAFDAPMHRMSMDAGNENRDLRRHEYLIYSEPWTASKIRRVAGIKLDESKLATIGSLSPVTQRYITRSKGRLFHEFQSYSNTKGAMVHMIFVKTTEHRFGQYFMEIELADRKSILVNEDDDTNPYGWDGLPFARLGGHRSAEGWVDKSDFDLLKDDQDILNLTITAEQRQASKSAGSQWDVDARWFGDQTNHQDVADQFTNEVLGIRVARPKKDAKPPLLQQIPGPQPYIGEIIRRQEENLQNQSFRPDSFFGGLKSHTTGDSVRRTMEAAGDVFGERVAEDIEQYAHLCRVMLGTGIQMVIDKNLTMIHGLRKRARFSEDDIAAIRKQDSEYPTGDVQIRESSARFRNSEAASQLMMQAVQMAAMTPAEFRVSMVNDLDMPVSESDRAAQYYAESVVRSIRVGVPFEPRPLRGVALEMVIACLEKAMMDTSSGTEEQVLFAQAIIAQRQFSMNMELSLMPPEPGQQPQAPAPDAGMAADPGMMLAEALSGQL